VAEKQASDFFLPPENEDDLLKFRAPARDNVLVKPL
jgi:hypothetical protein